MTNATTAIPVLSRLNVINSALSVTIPTRLTTYDQNPAARTASNPVAKLLATKYSQFETNPICGSNALEMYM